MKMKKYRVTYNVLYLYIDDQLHLMARELESKAVITFNVEASNRIQARQIANDLASTFLGRDFVIRGKTVRSLKPINIEEIE